MVDYPKKIWGAILLLDERFRELVDQGFEWVSNFPYSTEPADLFPEEFSIWEAKRNLEKDGYEAVFANAYTRDGKFMMYSKSLWKRKNKHKKIRLTWKGKKYILQLWYPDRLELKNIKTGSIEVIETTWRRRKDGKPADDYQRICRSLYRRGFDLTD
jgi:hypothetical protein